MVHNHNYSLSTAATLSIQADGFGGSRVDPLVHVYDSSMDDDELRRHQNKDGHQESDALVRVSSNAQQQRQPADGQSKQKMVQSKPPPTMTQRRKDDVLQRLGDDLVDHEVDEEGDAEMQSEETSVTAPNPALWIFDLDWEFQRPRRWGGRYASRRLEDLFTLFHVCHPLVATLYISLIPLMTVMEWIFIEEFGDIMDYIACVSVLLTVALAVVHFIVCVKPYRRVKWLNSESIPYRVVLAAKWHERLHFVLHIMCCVALVNAYPFAQRCVRSRLDEGLPLPSARHPCGGQVFIWTFMTQLAFVLGIKSRYFRGLILLLLFPAVFIYPLWPLAPDADTDIQFAAHVIAVAASSGFTAVFYVLLEGVSRQRFEAVMRLRDAERKAVSSRKAIHTTLSSLLPNVERLSRNELLVDVNAECCVSHFRLHDFGRWTTQLTPDTVMCVLEMLVGAFDDRVAQLDIDKLVSRGDEYLTTTNLRTEDNQTASPSDQLFPLYQLAVWQLTVIRRMRRKLLRTTPVSGAVAVYTGSIVGMLVGSAQLSYEVFGAGVVAAADMSKSGRSDCVVALLCDIPETLQHHFVPGPQLLNGRLRTEESGDIRAAVLYESPTISREVGLLCDPHVSLRLASGEEKGRDRSPSPVVSLRLSVPDQQRLNFLRQHARRHSGGSSDTLITDTSASNSRPDEPTDLEVVKHISAAQSYADSKGSEHSVPSSAPSTLVTESKASFTTIGKYIWVHYTDPTTEKAFADFLFCRWETSTVFAQCLFIACAAMYQIVSVIDRSVTLSSSLVLLATCLFCSGRLLYAHYTPRREQRRGVHFLSITIALCLVVAVLLMLEVKSVLNSRSLFGYAVPALMVYIEFTNYTAAVHVPAIVALMELDFGIYCFMRGFDLLNVALCLIVLPLGLIWISIDHERRNRAYFEALFRMDCAKTVALQETALFHALLEMTIPAALRQAVTKKAEGEADYLDVVQWLGDLCTAGVSVESYRELDLGDRGVEEILTSIRTTADIIDLAFKASTGLLERFATFGDTFFIAGPLKTTEELAQSGAASGRTKLLQLTSSPEDELFLAAVALMDFVLALRKRMKGRVVTAAITSGSAFSAVIGRTRPNFELQGCAMRAVRSTLDAAPTGSIVALAPFWRLLEVSNRCPPRFNGDFVAGEPESWALRDAGVVRVRHLRVTEG